MAKMVKEGCKQFGGYWSILLCKTVSSSIFLINI